PDQIRRPLTEVSDCITTLSTTIQTLTVTFSGLLIDAAPVVPQGVFSGDKHAADLCGTGTLACANVLSEEASVAGVPVPHEFGSSRLQLPTQVQNNNRRSFS